MAAVAGAAREIWMRLVDELLGVPGVEARRSRFADLPALWVDGREFLHLDSDGSIDVRLTRALVRTRRDELAEDERVFFRRSPSADWVHVVARSADDVDFVAALARDASEANRA